MRAARLTAIAEAATCKPDISANDIVRLDNAASRARADMAAVISANPSKQIGPDSLREYAAKLSVTA